MRATVVILAVALVAFMGCTQAGRKGAAYGPDEQARAGDLFQTVTEQQRAGNVDAAAAAAAELINGYPRFEKRDEALYRAGQIADARGRHADAVTFYTALSTDFPLSSFRPPALRAAAADYAVLRDAFHEAEALLEFLRTPAEPAEREDASRRLMELADGQLGQSDLDALARRYPDSALARQAAFKRARLAYAAGDYDRCYQLVGDYLDSLPSGEAHADARRLMEMAVERRQAPPPGPLSRVNPDRVGLLLPQTGSLALYGRLFEQGAKLAVEDHNQEHARHVSLVAGDSRGGAAGAVKAVRRLVAEDGVIAIVGDVFTLAAISGAIEANAWRAPVVSPVIPSDEIVEIGPWIFQTRVPATVEATAVAEAATGALALERFAILSPARGERREVGDFFAQEVQRMGRQVVAAEYFEDGSTDFRAQLERIREAVPDALFAVGSVEELLQILPQSRFFDLHVQMLGISQWNSDKLLRLGRDEMEGALFAADSHYGSTPEIEAMLKAKLATAGAAEASPVSVAGYYGMRAVLAAVADGATSREDVRAMLDGALRGDAATRMERARIVPLVRVRNGRVEPFAR
ncbi:MAG: ABC transporter substrate-binding protein [Candidatus Krumholzibacteria bacterium]|nr:ABC transporter substrate-binding protein [Candidatus Krumholzibacteria bacterium]MDH4337270.1 ABC transporter substrate-binding protein [Candidatus Krumholzibacteria bacterium]MDH5270017.1 ABC transporter substrate-binding protein [Candidatus Krumholzibacteria bacterium]